MKHRTLGRTGLVCSEVSLGTWAFSSSPYGTVAAEDATATVRAAVDSGVTVFDTAPLYGTESADGTAEELLGRALGPQRDEVCVLSKFGRRSTDGSRAEFSARTLHASVDHSLRRLATDRIDVLFFHSPSGDHEVDDDVWSAMDAMRSSGKVRYVGHSISWFADTEAMARRWVEERKIDVVQVALNLLHRQTQDFISEMGRTGVGVVVREALANGFLSDAVSRTTQFPEGHINARYQPDELRARFDQVERLSFLVREDIQSMATAALRWVLDHEGVSTVLAGATSPAQIRNSCAASAANSFGAEDLALARHLHDRDWAVA